MYNSFTANILRLHSCDTNNTIGAFLCFLIYDSGDIPPLFVLASAKLHILLLSAMLSFVFFPPITSCLCGFTSGSVNLSCCFCLCITVNAFSACICVYVCVSACAFFEFARRQTASGMPVGGCVSSPDTSCLYYSVYYWHSATQLSFDLWIGMVCICTKMSGCLMPGQKYYMWAYVCVFMWAKCDRMKLFFSPFCSLTLKHL